MIGKPRRLMVSWRWTSAITRFLRFRSKVCSMRIRCTSSIRWLSTGCSVEIMKNTHRISAMPIGAPFVSAAAHAVQFRLEGLEPLEQIENDRRGEEADAEFGT